MQFSILLKTGQLSGERLAQVIKALLMVVLSGWSWRLSREGVVLGRRISEAVVKVERLAKARAPSWNTDWRRIANCDGLGGEGLEFTFVRIVGRIEALVSSTLSLAVFHI